MTFIATSPAAVTSAAPLRPLPLSRSRPVDARMRFRHVPLPDHADSATRKTLKLAQVFADGAEGARNPIVRAAALRIVQSVPSRDHRGEIQALFDWQRRAIAFRGEKGETLQTPLVTLRLRAGDCDDHATLLAALLQALGYSTRFTTVAGDPRHAGEFSHVYLEVRDKAEGGWIPLDTTVPRARPGWQPENVSRKRTWEKPPAPPARAWSTARALGDSAPAYPLTPGQAFTYSLAQPLEQALAQRIAYPGGTALFANSSALGVNLSKWAGWGLLLFGGVLAFRAVSGARR